MKLLEKAKGFFNLNSIWNLEDEVEHDSDVHVDAVVDSRGTRRGCIRVVRSGNKYYAQTGNGISQRVTEDK